jgi:uncharacterized protein (DUF2062 family)
VIDPRSLLQSTRELVHRQVTQGLSSEKIAMTVAVGLCISINPIIGTTTIFSFVAAWALGLNQPIMQAINWSSYALQLLMLVPFIRLGEWLFGAPPERRPISRLISMLRTDFTGGLLQLRTTFGHAFVAWLAISPLLVTALYFGTLPFFRKLSRRLASPAKPADVPGGEVPGAS